MVNPKWPDTFKPGDCSMADNTTKSIFDKCIFTHPWIPDSADLFDEKGLGLVNNLKERMTEVLMHAALVTLFLLTITILPLICLVKKILNAGSKKVKTS